jgi:small subunit ribosomal protein S17e
VVSVTVLGKVRIGKVKSVSNEVVSKYGTAFSTDFDSNKKLIFQYTDIRSKHLKNRVAGYITRLLVSQKKREDALKLEEAELASQEAVDAPTAEAVPMEAAQGASEASEAPGELEEEPGEEEEAAGDEEAKDEASADDSAEASQATPDDKQGEKA